MTRGWNVIWLSSRNTVYFQQSANWADLSFTVWCTVSPFFGAVIGIFTVHGYIRISVPHIGATTCIDDVVLNWLWNNECTTGWKNSFLNISWSLHALFCTDGFCCKRLTEVRVTCYRHWLPVVWCCVQSPESVWWLPWARCPLTLKNTSYTTGSSTPLKLLLKNNFLLLSPLFANQQDYYQIIGYRMPSGVYKAV